MFPVITLILFHAASSTPQYYPLNNGYVDYFEPQPMPFYQELNPFNWLSREKLPPQPLILLDLKIYALYEILKCWEKEQELKKCTGVIERCDALFGKGKPDAATTEASMRRETTTPVGNKTETTPEK